MNSKRLSIAIIVTIVYLYAQSIDAFVATPLLVRTRDSLFEENATTDS